MSNVKYLYGAAVQGIQGFIFQTDKLKEMAGASELVEQVCTSEFAIAMGKDEESLKVDSNLMLSAAGNVKYIFEDKNLLSKVVLNFPKRVAELSPGIYVSQAVVEFDEHLTQDTINELEANLQAQRNNPLRPIALGFMSANRCRRTGLPASRYFPKSGIPKNKENPCPTSVPGDQINSFEPIDLGTARKIEAYYDSRRVAEKFFSKSPSLGQSNDFREILTKDKGWLAVVHADGNNLGRTIQEMSKQFSNHKNLEYALKFREFSKMLDEATVEAASQAYATILETALKKDRTLSYHPCRPIILGGDDLTLIIRGDLALDFTKAFLQLFEKKTKEKFGGLNVEVLKNGLTACAGIAFIKESYPFHYGYDLAEQLCSHAKKEAGNIAGEKELTPSCLMFHKVQDAFTEKYPDIIDRELTAKRGKTRFDYGPYYINEQKSKVTVDRLFDCVSKLDSKEDNALKSGLRQYLSLLHTNPGLAKQRLERLASDPNKSMVKNLVDPQGGYNRPITVDKESLTVSPVYDWLTVHSIMKGEK